MHTHRATYISNRTAILIKKEVTLCGDIILMQIQICHYVVESVILDVFTVSAVWSLDAQDLPECDILHSWLQSEGLLLKSVRRERRGRTAWNPEGIITRRHAEASTNTQKHWILPALIKSESERLRKTQRGWVCGRLCGGGAVWRKKKQQREKEIKKGKTFGDESKAALMSPCNRKRNVTPTDVP